VRDVTVEATDTAHIERIVEAVRAVDVAYTPGVARICRAIADDSAKVWNVTVKQHAVAGALARAAAHDGVARRS